MCKIALLNMFFFLLKECSLLREAYITQSALTKRILGYFVGSCNLLQGFMLGVQDRCQSSLITLTHEAIEASSRISKWDYRTYRLQNSITIPVDVMQVPPIHFGGDQMGWHEGGARVA